MAASITPNPDDFARVRAAMAAGRLEELMRTATAGEQAALYTIVHDIVYKLTQQRERARGHLRCAVSPDHMEPECHDRLQDNVAVVREDLLRHGTVRILNPEGWLRSRYNAVTVDAHRRERGERGALQRPRMPQWLGRRLAGEWPHQLALEIMTWVGVPHSAGPNLWPLSAWADLRDRVTGVTGSSEADVAADVRMVLAVMRTNESWYEQYIENPFGHKQPRVMPAQRHTAEDGGREPRHLVPVQRDETVDALLRGLAAVAVEAIASRITAGEDVTETVISVLNTVFTGRTGAYELGDVPGIDTDPAEPLEVLLGDPATVQRIVKTVIEIIRQRGATQ
ncbi:MAG TPA: hypothetical protein VFB74_08985 [Kribbellaceae bacterium]|nr:hypothetical protein [Kribbellaceae bacterium]